MSRGYCGSSVQEINKNWCPHLDLRARRGLLNTAPDAILPALWWCIMPSSTRWPSWLGVHTSLEVCPSVLRFGNVSLWNWSTPLVNDVKKNEEIAGTAVEDAVQNGTIMATQFA